MKKVGLRLTGCENAIFYFLPFPFTQISKDYCQKYYNGLWRFFVVSTTSQIFLIYRFLKMKRRPFYFILFFFSICTDMHFGSLFLLNEWNMTTFLLMIDLKCTVVHYTNLNWSSKNKPFLNLGTSSGQLQATENHWKIVKNTFYFILTNWICYWQIRFCTHIMHFH